MYQYTRRIPKQPYRRLARTATRIETDSTAAPERQREAKGELPDAETLIQRSHSEHLTGAELARAYETNARTVYTVLEEGGRRREELWAPPKAPRAPKRMVFEDWGALQRDYEAGDAPLVLTERYGIRQQVIDRNLKSVPGLHVRDREEAVDLRSRQRAEADKVRHHLRTGALEAAARDLGVPPTDLRLVLETHGLLLHDLG